MGVHWEVHSANISGVLLGDKIRYNSFKRQHHDFLISNFILKVKDMEVLRDILQMESINTCNVNAHLFIQPTNIYWVPVIVHSLCQIQGRYKGIDSILKWLTAQWGGTCMRAKSLSHVWLLATQRTVAHQASLSTGFSKNEHSLRSSVISTIMEI